MRDKIIVITGASAGIGAALAERVAREGARPVLVARRVVALHEVAKRIGGEPFVHVADVTHRSEVEAVVKAVIEKFGRIDVWVNNAGRGISRLVSQLTDEDIDEMMSVNLKSALYGMQAVLPHFQEREQGHIINVSSMLSRLPMAVFRSAYSASKHALSALTANLRMELASTYPRIFVSSVHPGVVATEFGLNARHGGMDSRQFPGAQSAEDVASVIAEVIRTPRADVYSRPEARQLVANYFLAEDMGEAEKNPPFMAFARPPKV